MGKLIYARNTVGYLKNDHDIDPPSYFCLIFMGTLETIVSSVSIINKSFLCSLNSPGRADCPDQGTHPSKNVRYRHRIVHVSLF